MEWPKVETPKYFDIVNSSDGNWYLSLPFATSTGTVPIVSGLLGGLAIGSYVAISLFTLGHAIATGGKRRKKREVTGNSELEDAFYRILTEELNRNIANASVMASEVEELDLDKLREDFRRILTLTLPASNLFQRLKTESVGSQFIGIGAPAEVLQEIEQLSSAVKDVESDEKFPSRDAYSQEGEKRPFPDQGYVDIIFSQLSAKECNITKAVCDTGGQVGKDLTNTERRSLRSFRFGSLRKYSATLRSIRKLLAFATVLLYSNPGSCSRIADRCLFFAKRRND